MGRDTQGFLRCGHFFGLGGSNMGASFIELYAIYIYCIVLRFTIKCCRIDNWEHLEG